MAMRFPDASFDIAVSGLGFNYIPDRCGACPKSSAFSAPAASSRFTCGTTQKARGFCESSGTQLSPSIPKPLRTIRPGAFQSARRMD